MITNNLIVFNGLTGSETVLYYLASGDSVKICDLRLIRLALNHHYTRVYRIHLDDSGHVSLILIYDKDNILQEVVF